MNKKILSSSIIALGLIAIVVAGSVSASGFGFRGERNIDPQEMAIRQQEMFAHQAEMLGINVDSVKAYWAEGKNMFEIAQELNISQETLDTKRKESRTKMMQERMQDLVSQGVITQDQANKRLQFMESQGDNHRGHKGNRGN